jgi:hypothetical protein
MDVYEKKLLRLQQNDPTLHSLSCFPGLDVSEVGPALTTNTHLRELCLGYNPTFNESNVIDLANGIRQSKIEKLTVFSDLFENEDQSDLWTVLRGGIQASSTIQELFLHFAREPLFAPFEWLGTILSSVPTLKKLTLYQCHRRVIGPVLSNNLSKSSSLSTLVLRICFTGFAINNLVQILRQSSSLTRLELDECGIDGDALELLVDRWHPSLTIRSLRWQSFSLGGGVLKTLLRAVASGRMPLHELDLSLYQCSVCHTLQILGEALPSLTNVTHVSLSLNGWDTPTRDLQNKASLALLNGMKVALQLQKLSITGDYRLSHEFPNEHGFYMSLIRHGRYLLATNHGLASTVWCHILEKCRGPHGSSTVFYFLREQPSLIQPRC